MERTAALPLTAVDPPLDQDPVPQQAVEVLGDAALVAAAGLPANAVAEDRFRADA